MVYLSLLVVITLGYGFRRVPDLSIAIDHLSDCIRVNTRFARIGKYLGAGAIKALAFCCSAKEMSDYKGAALMVDALPNAKELPGAGSGRASLPNQTGKSRFPSTKHFIAAATRSKTCSESLRTGDLSTRAMTDAHTSLCPPSQSPLPSSSGSINEF
jgi:hypothetical protein